VLTGCDNCEAIELETDSCPVGDLFGHIVIKSIEINNNNNTKIYNAHIVKRT